MSPSAINVEGLGKRYRIGLEEEKHETLAGTVGSWFKAPLTNYRRLRKLKHFLDDEADDVVWALRDISFEVQPGEVVGIIGPNGAGKSTLLKILSRITEPTTGRAVIQGRVSSLLEVGTGFHQELTGRENVYLNGAVLGMSKDEIDRKFDEIVAFAEVGRFIETPVKRYSSGMRVRLAFAVAAHLEPEVLIVDEVLSVGDLAFQKKCIGKMGDVAGEGRTVLFVSHNMAAVSRLCESGIVLDKGRLVRRGSVGEAIEYYTNHVLKDDDDVEANGKDVFVDRIDVERHDDVIDASRPTRVRFRLHVRRSMWHVKALFTVRNSEQALMVREELTSKQFPTIVEEGVYEVVLTVPPLWLRTGHYSFGVKVLGDALGQRRRYVSDPLLLVVEGYTNGKTDQGDELLTPACEWLVESV